MQTPKYLTHYPESIQQQALQLLQNQTLGDLLKQKYPQAHNIQSNRALYDYAMSLKKRYLKKSAPISKVEYSDKVSAINALGTHTRVSRVQGSKLKAKQEIRIDSRFKKMPEAFLRMIIVHELSHIREQDHNKAFYQLCLYMEPEYHQLELDLRLYLCWLDHYPSLY